MTDWKKAGDLLQHLLNELHPGFLNDEVLGISNYDLNQTMNPITIGHHITKLDLRISCIITPKKFPAKELSEQLNSTFQQLKK